MTTPSSVGEAPPASPLPPIGHAEILRIALPITLSNATVPLVGFVDTAVIGQLGVAHLMGATAIGALTFSMLYWSFSFLRMSTTGLTAQALGAGDEREIGGHALRALLLAVLGGLMLLLLQVPIREAALHLTGGSPDVRAAARIYFDIRIWAAPAGLINFALLGWLIGLHKANHAFAIQLLLNIINIVLASLFVLGLGYGIEGVGYAALIAENVAALTGLAMAWRILAARGTTLVPADAIDPGKLRRSLSSNADLVLRSVASYAALFMFTSTGAAAGDVTLAANALLTSIQGIVIYLLDGFAFAAEAHVGRAIGARDKPAFWQAVWYSTFWAGIFAIALGLLIWFAGPFIIGLSARNPAVEATALVFLGWAAIAPFCGVWCFQLDGIFTGATRTRDMRNMMAVSVGVFFVAYWLLVPRFANHGLWAAFMLFFLSRAVTLGLFLPALVRTSFPRD